MGFRDWHYDRRFDILYIGNMKNTIAKETLKDIFVMHDRETDEISGYVLLGFRKRLSSGIYSQLKMDFDLAEVLATL
jgi:hypothetical protein